MAILWFEWDKHIIYDDDDGDDDDEDDDDDDDDAADDDHDGFAQIPHNLKMKGAP